MKDFQVALCTDTPSLENPSLIGLEGESLENQPWLRVFCSALEARQSLRLSPASQEVWVVASDDVDPINLAAALKKDAQEQEVHLVSFENSGSLQSRARAAGLDGMLNQQDFIERYSHHKQRGSSRPADLGQAELYHASWGSLVTEGNVFSEEPSSKVAPRSEGLRVVSSRTAPVFTVLSASGGSGKSTVAALTAYFTQGLGYNTVLLDADLQFGDLHFLLGEEHPLAIDEVVESPYKLEQLRSEGMRPVLIAAPRRLEQSETLLQEIPPLLDRLKVKFEVVVVNTGSFWTEQHALLLERSSTALFVLDQRPASMRACRHALDLCARCGIATHPFLFTLNKCSRNSPMTSIDASCALQGARVVELQDGGQEVDELLGAGMPLELINARNSLCLSIEQMVLDLLPSKPEKGRNVALPVERERRFFKRRGKRAACL